MRLHIGLEPKTVTLSMLMDTAIYNSLVDETVTTTQQSLGSAISWINAQLNARGLAQLLQTNPPVIIPSGLLAYNQGAIALIASSGVTPQVYEITLGENREILAELPDQGLIVFGETAVTGSNSMHNKLGYTQSVSSDFYWPDNVGPFACSNAVVGTSRYPDNFGLWVLVYPDCLDNNRLSYPMLAASDFAYVYMAYDQYSHNVTLTVGHGGRNVSTIPEELAGFWLFNQVPIEHQDPYEPGGTSGPDGGGGTHDYTSTDVPVPGLPSIGAVSTGFISMYRPGTSDLRVLASYLWSTSFDINNFKKLFANPMDCILGLHILPTSSGHPAASSSSLYVGNIDTGISMPRLTEQYYEMDCGTISILPRWGAYLDYSPYTKLSLFLPYIGFVPISPDDCMGGTIRVVYHVDALSGSCCALVYCTSNRGTSGHTLYTYTGSCACDCPVTEGQYTNALIGAIRGGVGLATGLMTGSVGSVMGGLEDAANAVMSMTKPDVNRSGSFGGSAGLMGIQYPYLVITVPKLATPADQNIYQGYPSLVATALSQVTGFASVKVTHMAGMSATDEEIAELVALLEEGVIF